MTATSLAPRLRYAILELTLRCNLRCVHCASAAGRPRPGELTAPEWDAVVADLVALGRPAVDLMGGEVLLSPLLAPVARSLTSRGMSWGLLTNGWLLDERRAAELVELGCRGIGVSVDGARAETHDGLRGRAGSHERALRAVAVLGALPFQPQNRAVLTSINTRNLGELERLGALLSRHAAGYRWQLNLCSAEAPRLPESLRLDAAGIERVVRFVDGARRDGRFDLRVTAAHDIGYFVDELDLHDHPWDGCPAGIHHLGVQSDGQVKGCLALDERCAVGNVRERGLRTLWEDGERFAAHRAFDEQQLGPECRVCVWGTRCRGGCTAYSMAVGGQPHAHPHCLWRDASAAARAAVRRPVLAATGGAPYLVLEEDAPTITSAATGGAPYLVLEEDAPTITSAVDEGVVTDETTDVPADDAATDVPANDAATADDPADDAATADDARDAAPEEWALPLRSACIELTLRCNLRCLHCGSAAGDRRAQELDLAEFIPLLRDLHLLGGERVVLLGGEPLLHPDWEEIALLARGFDLDVALITNGLPVTERVAVRCAALGLTHLGVSIDGASDEVHDTLRGVAGARRKAWTAVARLRAAGLPVTVITTLVRTNIGELPALREQLVAAGPGLVWQLQAANNVGERFRRELLVTPAEILRAARFIEETRRELAPAALAIAGGHNIGHHACSVHDYGTAGRWRGCPGGVTAVGICSDGSLKGCLSMSPAQIQGNLRERSLTALWRDPATFAAARAATPGRLRGDCAVCPHGSTCRGGCPEMARAATGDVWDNPFCLRQAERGEDRT